MASHRTKEYWWSLQTTLSTHKRQDSVSASPPHQVGETQTSKTGGTMCCHRESKIPIVFTSHQWWIESCSWLTGGSTINASAACNSNWENVPFAISTAARPSRLQRGCRCCRFHDETHQVNGGQRLELSGEESCKSSSLTTWHRISFGRFDSLEHCQMLRQTWCSCYFDARPAGAPPGLILIWIHCSRGVTVSLNVSSDAGTLQRSIRLDS